MLPLGGRKANAVHKGDDLFAERLRGVELRRNREDRLNWQREPLAQVVQLGGREGMRKVDEFHSDAARLHLAPPWLRRLLIGGFAGEVG